MDVEIQNRYYEIAFFSEQSFVLKTKFNYCYANVVDMKHGEIHTMDFIPVSADRCVHGCPAISHLRPVPVWCLAYKYFDGQPLMSEPKRMWALSHTQVIMIMTSKI